MFYCLDDEVLYLCRVKYAWERKVANNYGTADKLHREYTRLEVTQMNSAIKANNR